jgi:hypothetical protein
MKEIELLGSLKSTKGIVAPRIQTRIQTWMISKWRFFIAACSA